MIIQWLSPVSTDFDLDQAEEDFNFITEWDPDIDLEQVIYNIVRDNFAVDGEEYYDITPGIEIAAQALRNRIGGVQLRMELD